MYIIVDPPCHVVYLGVRGIDPKTHLIKQELVRCITCGFIGISYLHVENDWLIRYW